MLVRIILAIVVVLVIAASCDTDTAPTTLPVPETSATTATTEATTTTTTAETTTTAAPTTTEALELTQETYNAVVVFVFESDLREGIIEILDGEFSVQSVDLVDMRVDDDGPATLEIAITSIYRSDGALRDLGWEIGRSLAIFWAPGGMWAADGLAAGVEWPSLKLTVSTVTWTCDAATLTLLGDHRMTRAEWEDRCS